IIAPLLVGGIGMLAERYGLRRVHKFGHVAELVFTFGLAFLIEELVSLIWGQDTKSYNIPASLDFALFSLYDQNFPAYKAFMIAVSVAIFVGVYLLLTRTRVGIIIQAAIEHPNTVANLGHNVPFIFMSVFGVG